MSQTPTTTDKPSAGAIRATEAIRDFLRHLDFPMIQSERDTITAIIDRETRAPELIAALKSVQPKLEDILYIAGLDGWRVAQLVAFVMELNAIAEKAEGCA